MTFPLAEREANVIRFEFLACGIRRALSGHSGSLADRKAFHFIGSRGKFCDDLVSGNKCPFLPPIHANFGAGAAQDFARQVLLDIKLYINFVAVQNLVSGRRSQRKFRFPKHGHSLQCAAGFAHSEDDALAAQLSFAAGIPGAVDSVLARRQIGKLFLVAAENSFNLFTRESGSPGIQPHIALEQNVPRPLGGARTAGSSVKLLGFNTPSLNRPLWQDHQVDLALEFQQFAFLVEMQAAGFAAGFLRIELKRIGALANTRVQIVVQGLGTHFNPIAEKHADIPGKIGQIPVAVVFGPLAANFIANAPIRIEIAGLDPFEQAFAEVRFKQFLGTKFLNRSFPFWWSE